MLASMKKPLANHNYRAESPLFWLLLVVISVICFGGFTYAFSALSTPAGIEIISYNK